MNIRIIATLIILFSVFSDNARANSDVGNAVLGILGEIVNQSAQQQRIDEASRQDQEYRNAIQARENERSRAIAQARRAEEARSEQERREQEAKRAEDDEAYIEYTTLSTNKPCLDDVCVGMTVDEVVELGKPLVNGEDFEEHQFEQRKKMLVEGLNLGFFDRISAERKANSIRREELNRQRKANLEKAETLVGTSASNKAIFANQMGSYIDNDGLRAFASASQICDLFELKSIFQSDGGEATTIYFAPITDDYHMRVVGVEREYSYQAGEIDDLENLVREKFKNFNIIDKPQSNVERFSELPDILLFNSQDSQELWLIDRRIYGLQKMLGMPGNPTQAIQRLNNDEEFADEIKSKDGCKRDVKL